MAITATTGQTASNTTAGTSLAAAAFSATAGQHLLVAVALATTTASVSTITDTAGNTYARQSTITNGTSVVVELWAATGITGNASNVVTVTFSASTLAAIAIEEYSGLVSSYFGTPATATGTGTWPVASLTTVDGGSWTVAAIGFACSSGDTFSQWEGTIRQSVVPSLTSVGVALVDNAPGGDGTIPTGAGLSASRAWAAAAVEMRTHATAIVYAEYAGILPVPSTTLVPRPVNGLVQYIEPLRERGSLTTVVIQESGNVVY